MIRAKLARFLVKQMSSREIPLQETLLNTDISPDDLNHPDFTLEVSQLRQLMSNIALVSPDHPLGFELGEAISLHDLGIMGHALMSCPTLADLYPLWDSFYELVGTPIRNISEIENNTWSIEMRSVIPLGSIEQFCIEQHLGTTHRLASLLLEETLAFREINLTYPAPRYQLYYQKLFQCPIKFNQNRNVILFDKDQLTIKVASADSETFSLCTQYCQTQLEKLVRTNSIAGRIRFELVNSPAQVPNATQMASILGYSGRKLRRLLQEESTTYTEVIKQYRLDLAHEYLENSTLAPKQIGYLLGFDDTSSFRRAFKQWTGQTIGEYQAQLHSRTDKV